MKISIKDWLLIALIALFILAFFGMTFAAEKPYTIKSHQVSEDDTFVYYSDTKSDHTETTRKVPKPKPIQYPASVTLVATNDLPVMIEYVYAQLYADGTIKTNCQYVVKTQRDQAKITLPPMPEINRLEPARADALGQAIKRIAPKPIEITERKTMAKRDPVISRDLVGNDIHDTTAGNKLIITPLKRAFTARVAALNFAPPKISDDIDAIGDHPDVPRHQIINALETAVRHLPPDGQITGHPAVLLSPGQRLREQAAAADQREQDINFIQYTLQQLKKETE